MLWQKKYLYNVGIYEEEAPKEYDFFDHHGRFVYADSFGEAVSKETIWLVIFGELFAADCRLCDSNNVCGDHAGWTFNDGCGGCGMSFVCSAFKIFSKNVTVIFIK